MSDETSDDPNERLARLREAAADAMTRNDLAADGDERSDGHHHPAEAATDAEIRERQLSEQVRWRKRQEQLEAAEKALREGRYGICVDCGEPISEGRLRIRPDAVRCVPCQQRSERGG
jgi:DnaK suppressor protein